MDLHNWSPFIRLVSFIYESFHLPCGWTHYGLSARQVKDEIIFLTSHLFQAQVQVVCSLLMKLSPESCKNENAGVSFLT